VEGEKRFLCNVFLLLIFLKEIVYIQTG